MHAHPLRLLLTNDDGVDAPGLAALAAAMAPLGEVSIVAPDRHLSGCAHQTTTHRSLHVSPRGDRIWAVDGTPADCVRLGLLHLATGADWVLSGINAGGNLGVDTFMSGTVAAAREAALMGVAAFAISHYHRSGQPLDWARATQATQQLIPQLLKRSLAPSQFWNINFPAELSPQTSWLDCPLDPLPLRVKFRQENDGQYRYESDYHQRPRVPGGDVEVCFDGRIAVSRVEACAGFGAVTRTAAAHRL